MLVKEVNKKIKPFVHKYSLPQAIRVIRTYLCIFYPDESMDELYTHIMFSANPSLSFAKTEISHLEFVTIDGRVKVEITLNYMSLFGAASPLPSHYNEMVLDSANSDEVLKDFLNVFNHHIQKLIYPIWERNRYHIQYQSDLQDRFSKYMLSLLGLYSQTQVKSSKLDFKKLLPYIGLLSMRQKSAGTLVSILRHYLEHDELEIEQCITMSEKIPSWQFSTLGAENSNLGQNMLLGESIRTKTSKFQIVLKNVSHEGLYNYSVHGEKMMELRELIDLALHEPLEYELCLHIKREEIQNIDSKAQYLGVNSFCGEIQGDHIIIMEGNR